MPVREWREPRLKRSDGEIEGGSVQTIEAASARLARHGRSELGRRVEALCRQMGDEPIERDVKVGRFDQWIEEAKAQGAVTASERFRGLFRVLRAATSSSHVAE